MIYFSVLLFITAMLLVILPKFLFKLKVEDEDAEEIDLLLQSVRSLMRSIAIFLVFVGIIIHFF